MRARRRFRRVVLPATATLVLLAAWTSGCGSFSATGDGTDGDEAGADVLAPDSGPGARSDGAAVDAPTADARTTGCQVIEAGACFDFDHVKVASVGWSSFSLVGAEEPTLSPNGVSLPNAARFFIPVQDAGTTARPVAFLIRDDPGFPTWMRAKVMIATGPMQAGYIASYNVESSGNAVDLFYTCSTSSCAARFVAYTSPDGGAPTLTNVACGTFLRGQWTTIGLAIEAGPISGKVTCTIDTTTTTMRTPPFGAAKAPQWEIGVGDQNVGGPFGGQVVYFDDVAFR